MAQRARFAAAGQRSAKHTDRYRRHAAGPQREREVRGRTSHRAAAGVAALLGDELDPPLLAEVAGEPGCCQPRDAHPDRAGPGEAPSVGTLVRVADALGASVAQLVEVADAPAVPVVRASEAVPLWRRDQGNVVMLLAGTSSRSRSSCGNGVLSPATATPARRTWPGRVSCCTCFPAAHPHRRGRDTPGRGRRHGAVRRGPRTPVRQRGRQVRLVMAVSTPMLGS
jgi:hypothetical protein